MRKVQGPPSGAEYDYTPEVKGDPIVVRLKIPTEADKRRFGRVLRGAMKFDDSGEAVKDSDGNIAIEIDQNVADRWQQAMLLGCVVSVTGYADNRGEPIRSGADLFEHGESEIVNLVVAEIQTGYTMLAEKKSASDKLSDSPSPTLPPSDGIASSVASGVSTEQEAANLVAEPKALSSPEPESSPDAPLLG